MSSATRKSRHWASSDGLGSRRLELERSADVNRLAVAAVVLERRCTIALDIVANAAGQRAAMRQVLGSAGIERHVVATTKCCDRIRIPLGADGDARAELVAERVADAEYGAFAAADRWVRTLRLGNVA